MGRLPDEVGELADAGLAPLELVLVGREHVELGLHLGRRVEAAVGGLVGVRGRVRGRGRVRVKARARLRLDLVFLWSYLLLTTHLCYTYYSQLTSAVFSASFTSASILTEPLPVKDLPRVKVFSCLSSVTWRVSE